MAPTYKFTYFPIKGLGEYVRYLLSYGGVDFEDERISMEEFPKQLKQTLPFGQLPILEVNGKRAHQSKAISRYLAKQFKLTGNNDWEDLEIDSIVDTVNDFRSKIAAVFYEADEVVKANLKEALFKESLPFYLERLEAIAKANKGHLALGRLTWADLYFASMADMLKWYSGANIFAGTKNLQAVIDNVESIPAIKAWIERRSKSDY